MLAALNLAPYRINMNGTGIATAAIPPRILIAGPTPKVSNMGLAANGSPAAITERRTVFPDTALAAYIRYVSTRKLIHCWNIILKLGCIVRNLRVNKDIRRMLTRRL